MELIQLDSRNRRNLCYEEVVAKNYKLVKGKLFYKDQNPDGTDYDRLVVKRNEAERVFLECYLTAGGHKGRNATVGKIKERYYWPNFKEIEEKVHIAK